jgi:predicted nucleic acid-binding protein
MKVVIDTSAWIEYFQGTTKGKIVDEYLKNNETLTPSIVLLELSYKADKEKWDMKKHLDFMRFNTSIIGLNDSFVLEFGRIYNEAKKKAKDFGLADAIVLTTAKMNDGKVLTCDKHFSGFDNSIML